MSEFHEFGRQLRDFLRGFLAVDESPVRSKPPQGTDIDEVRPPQPPNINPRPEPQRPPSTDGDATLPNTLAMADKQAGIEFVDTLTEEPELVQLKGVFGKGCLQATSDLLKRPQHEDWDLRVSNTRMQNSTLRLSVFQGELYSEKTNGPVSVKLNPMFESVGIEVSEQEGSEYPKVQEFRQYTLMTFSRKLSDADEESIKMTVGNKPEDPIWVTAKLNRPMGEDGPIKYELMRDRIPLWHWDDLNMEFFDISPITNKPAEPVAYILREHDKQTVNRVWKREDREQTSELKYLVVNAD